MFHTVTVYVNGLLSPASSYVLNQCFLFCVLLNFCGFYYIIPRLPTIAQHIPLILPHFVLYCKQSYVSLSGAPIDSIPCVACRRHNVSMQFSFKSIQAIYSTSFSIILSLSFRYIHADGSFNLRDLSYIFFTYHVSLCLCVFRGIRRC